MSVGNVTMMFREEMILILCERFKDKVISQMNLQSFNFIG